ncbi:MAG: multidrug efflux SMR transporter [Micromonosporaceae bacterium]
MTIGWTAVLIAGLLEVAWAHSIRLTEGFTRLVPSAVCVGLTAAVIYVLNIAMQHLPVGTAYAVFVGIGAVGATAVGIVWLDEPINPGRALALALIIGGVILLRLVDNPAASA